MQCFILHGLLQAQIIQNSTNSMRPSINFTKEVEEDSQLLFLVKNWCVSEESAKYNCLQKENTHWSVQPFHIQPPPKDEKWSRAWRLEQRESVKKNILERKSDTCKLYLKRTATQKGWSTEFWRRSSHQMTMDPQTGDRTNQLQAAYKKYTLLPTICEGYI